MRRGQHILTREPAHRRQDMVAPAYGGRHTARRSHKAADPGWSRFISAHVHKNITKQSFLRRFLNGYDQMGSQQNAENRRF